MYYSEDTLNVTGGVDVNLSISDVPQEGTSMVHTVEILVSYHSTAYYDSHIFYLSLIMGISLPMTM